MQRIVLLFISLSLALGIGFGCSSTPSSSDGGSDATSDANKPDGPATDGGGDGASGFTLTINDYLNWCSVVVNNGTPSTADPQTFNFAPNTVVNLSADKANATFVWGYWVGTDNSPDGGDKQMATTVTMTSDKLIQACCPFATSPNTPCPPPQ